MDNYQEIEEYLKFWAERTERIVGAKLKKYKVIISEPDQKNIVIDIFRKALSTIGITISMRDALRFVDMGAGRGYNKGRATSQRQYRKYISKPRIRKAVFNRPIYSAIANLSDVLTLSITNIVQKEIMPNEQK